jgi:ubiquinone/menaquinone biosynthesis C-methylase UbiE
MRLEITQNIYGSILDIGGGGEGVIGQLFGNRVIAIDNRQEELDEAPDCCEKRLMDATDLTFPDYSFDNVTFFYSLMYMFSETQVIAIAEASRVLKKGGSLYIWDTEIRKAFPEPHIVSVEIPCGRNTITATYGIVKEDSQNREAIIQRGMACGLSLQASSINEGHFFLQFKK